MSATKKTLSELNKELTELAAKKRRETMLMLGITSETTFYDRIRRPWICSPVERQELCNMFGVTQNDVDWQKPTKQKLEKQL